MHTTGEMLIRDGRFGSVEVLRPVDEKLAIHVATFWTIPEDQKNGSAKENAEHFTRVDDRIRSLEVEIDSLTQALRSAHAREDLLSSTIHHAVEALKGGNKTSILLNILQERRET